MRRKIHLLLLALLIACAIAFTQESAWAADRTLADVAYQEYLAGVSEQPAGSGSVKYNDWYYGGSVHNTVIQGSYTLELNWNAVFASWCADQLGYIESGFFPLADNAEVMLQWFCLKGYNCYLPSEAVSESGVLNVFPGDVLFIPDDNGKYEVAIVADADHFGVRYVSGDVDGAVGFFQRQYTSLPDSAMFFPIIDIKNYSYEDISLFLMDEMHLNPAAICGIVANIAHESGGDPTRIGDSGQSYGICQWYTGRFMELVSFCTEKGYDWESIDGQLRFLQYELDTNFKELKTYLESCPSTREGAYNAGYAFCVSYEYPDELKKNAALRGSEARDNFFDVWFS